VKRITALLRDGVRFGLPHLRRILATCDRYLPRKLRRRIVLERYFYDGADVIADYGLFGRRCRASYLTPFLDENLLMESRLRFGCVKRFWFTQDGLGSVRQLHTDESNVCNSYTYTAWGEPLNWSETIPNRYTYTSREYNAESGDYYYRARYYQPMTSRFVSRDPLDGTTYLYAHNNPICWIDPFGLHHLPPMPPFPPKVNDIECCRKWLEYAKKVIKVVKEHIKLAKEEMAGKFIPKRHKPWKVWRHWEEVCLGGWKFRKSSKKEWWKDKEVRRRAPHQKIVEITLIALDICRLNEMLDPMNQLDKMQKTLKDMCNPKNAPAYREAEQRLHERARSTPLSELAFELVVTTVTFAAVPAAIISIIRWLPKAVKIVQWLTKPVILIPK